MQKIDTENISEDCSLICERRRAFFAVILAVSILGLIYGGVKIARDAVSVSETTAR